jgi:hypothetical protein
MNPGSVPDFPESAARGVGLQSFSIGVERVAGSSMRMRVGAAGIGLKSYA